MVKSEEISNVNSCLNKAADDEPLFVLRAQDKFAPMLVRLWADLAQDHGCDVVKIMDARNLVLAMKDWPTTKYPD